MGFEKVYFNIGSLTSPEVDVLAEWLEPHQSDDGARGCRACHAEDGLEEVALLAVLNGVQCRAQPERRDAESLEVRPQHIVEAGPSSEETHGVAMIAG